MFEFFDILQFYFSLSISLISYRKKSYIFVPKKTLVLKGGNIFDFFSLIHLWVIAHFNIFMVFFLSWCAAICHRHQITVTAITTSFWLNLNKPSRPEQPVTSTGMWMLTCEELQKLSQPQLNFLQPVHFFCLYCLGKVIKKFLKDLLNVYQVCDHASSLTCHVLVVLAITMVLQRREPSNLVQ